MANYFEMSKDQLRAEKAALEQSYAEFKAKGLKLNMAPAVNQALIRWTWPWIC